MKRKKKQNEYSVPTQQNVKTSTNKNSEKNNKI